VTRLDCEKVAQNIAQPVFFCQNLYITGAVENRSPDPRATSVIFKPLPKVNNRPLSENSPNLVTLPGGHYHDHYFDQLSGRKFGRFSCSYLFCINSCILCLDSSFFPSLFAKIFYFRVKMFLCYFVEHTSPLQWLYVCF
jgi:hypothetical protein